MRPENPSKIYYSKNSRSYTGAHYAHNCVSGSKWRLTWNRTHWKMRETLMEINTDPAKYNGNEIGEWLDEIQ